MPTAGLLAQVLVAKYGDHLPLYRQEQIFGRAGLAIPRSTLGAWVGRCGVQLQPLVDALGQAILQQQVLHADETPVQMLSPGKGKTHRAYLWAYTSTQFSELRAVVYDFAESRAGAHARAFLAYFGERDRRFRERDRFGGVGRCAVSIVDFLVSSGRVRAPGRWVWERLF